MKIGRMVQQSNPVSAAAALPDSPCRQVGTYTPEERKRRIKRYLEKRKRRVETSNLVTTLHEEE
jgi:hypothetical protein